jgi:nitrogen fixation protein FixH
VNGRYWPAAIVGLLAANAAIVAVTVRYALQGQGSSVEADYYQKAVHWDEHVAQLRQNAKLGWRAEVVLSPQGVGHASPAALVRLTDASGQPIRGAVVSGRFFHFAHADQATTGTLNETPEGYVTALPELWPGVWNASLDVRMADHRFTSDQDLHVVAVR